MMSGQRYAQATSEESTQLVTNKASVNPMHWNTSIGSYEETPSYSSGSQTGANLVSNFSNLQLSSHSSSYMPSLPSEYSQFPASTISSPSVHSENRGAQNIEVPENRQAAVSDQHLK